MQYLKVGVDLDGVVANFSYSFSQVLRKLYGEHLPIIEDNRNIKHWDWDLWYPELNREQYLKAWNYVINNEISFWENIPLLNDEEWFNFLKLNNYPNLDIYFITSRANVPGDSVTRQSQIWLNKHGWNNPQVIVTSEKEQFVRILKLKYFIDDKKENCESVSITNPDCKVYVYDALHNRQIEDFKLGIKRIYSLDEFTNDILKEIV